MSNSPSFDDADVLEFFETSTRNLLAAEAAAGVRHHVALSVVGDRPAPRQRVHAGEGRPGEADRGVRIPYSIVRATQFFEFVSGIVDGATVGDTVHLAAGADPADGRRRRGGGGGRGGGGHADERGRRGRRPGAVPLDELGRATLAPGATPARW